MNDAHLWAETYDRKLIDIFSVESEIAKTIADTLQAKLTGSEKKMMTAQSTNDTTAYELYHKGKSLWQRRAGDNIPKAIEFYEQAIQRDQNYALAYAGLGNAYVLLPFYTGARQGDAFLKAKAATQRALEIDPDLPEAHAALGKIHNFADIDMQGSIREFERAIELNPNDASAHHWLGSGPLLSLARFDEAIAHCKRSVELDPLSPVMMVDYGSIFFYAKRYDESIPLLRKAVEMDPSFGYAYQTLAIAYQAKGDLRNAIAEFEKAKQADDAPIILAQWAAAKAWAGDKETAGKTLAELPAIAQRREVGAYDRAILHLSLGDKNEAMRWLERSFDDRDGANIGTIKVDPLLESLRGDPRFEALVQKVIAPKTESKK